MLAIAVLLLGACRSAGRPAPPSSASLGRASSAAASALVAAVGRSLRSTWSVDEQFDRTAVTGAHIGAEQHRAQRPPDRLTEAAGTIDARRNGRIIACATDAAGLLQCRDGGAAAPYDDDVSAGVAAMTQLVEGSNPLYAVASAGAGCFELTLRQPGFLAPPYGDRGELCFDSVTGAPVRTEIHRAEGTDLTVATRVRGTVSDADLDVPVPGR